MWGVQHWLGAMTFSRTGPDDINISVGPDVFGKDVVVWDDNHTVWIPDFGFGSKLLLKNPECPRATDIMSEKLVHIRPDIITRRDLGRLRMLCQNLLCERQSMLHLRSMFALWVKSLQHSLNKQFICKAMVSTHG